MAAHLFGGGAQELGPHAGEAAVAHQDQVKFPLPGHLEDGLRGMAEVLHGFQLDPGFLGPGPGRGQDFAGLLVGVPGVNFMRCSSSWLARSAPRI